MRLNNCVCLQLPPIDEKFITPHFYEMLTKTFILNMPHSILNTTPVGALTKKFICLMLIKHAVQDENI